MMTAQSEMRPRRDGTPTRQTATLLGERMQQARAIAGYDLQATADGIGVRPERLALVEAGEQLLGVNQLIAAAGFLGTTVDYLCGLTEDCDRDPAVMTHRLVSEQLAGAARRICEELASLGVEAVRSLVPDAELCARLAAATVDVQRALVDARRIDPAFDDVHGSAKLVRRIECAAELAMRHLERLARERRRAEGLASHVDVAALARLPAA
jgi:transcriptional regulator with XRE-family HTH domain